MLRRQVECFAPKAEFHCLEPQFKGRWAGKMCLFSPENRWARPCFYMDLDTIVRGYVEDLLEPSEDLWLLTDFLRPKRGNSGLMRVPVETDEIWEGRPSKRDYPDGNYLHDFPHQRLQDHFDGIKSYKVHCKAGPGDARIVCFHGRPKPHDVEEGWVVEHYRRFHPK